MPAMSEHLVWAVAALLGAIVPLARYGRYKDQLLAPLAASVVMAAGLAPMVLLLIERPQLWSVASAHFSIGGLQLALTAGLWAATLWLLLPKRTTTNGNRREALFDLMPEGYAVLDPDGLILDCNSSFTALSAVRQDEFIGANIRLILPAVADLMTSDNELFINALEIDGRHYRVREIQLNPSLERGESLLTVQDVSAEFVARQQAADREANLQVLQARLDAQSNLDTLTGLYNERYFVLKLAQEIERSERSSSNFGVLSIELDHFDQLCERLGNKVGDETLVRVARTLEAQVRNVDTLARVGRDQFLVLALDANSEGLQIAAKRMKSALTQATIPIDHDVELSVAASVGVASAGPNSTLQGLIARADSAMRASRGEVGSQVELF